MRLNEDGSISIGRKLVIADVHLGILGFPDFNVRDMIIESVEKYKARTLILNGDVKHSLGRYELKALESIIEEIADRVSELLIVKGNHDGLLHEIHEVHDYVADEGFSVLHGHREIEDALDSKVIITAHSHPAVLIKDRVSGHKERSWLIGRFDDRKVIVMPAFNELCSSTAVNLERPAGFIYSYVNEFDAITLDGFYFGRVKF